MNSRRTLHLAASLLVGACGGNDGSVGLFGEDSGGVDGGTVATGGGTTTATSGATVDDTGGTMAPASDEAQSDGGIKFDTQTDTPINPGGDCGCGNDEWSYIWI